MMRTSTKTGTIKQKPWGKTTVRKVKGKPGETIKVKEEAGTPRLNY